MDKPIKGTGIVVTDQKKTGVKKPEGTQAIIGDLGKPASYRVLVTIKEFNGRHMSM